MSVETILFIILAGVVAFALAFFIYGYKSKQNRKLSWILGSLRFVTLFAILVLLINPKFKSEKYNVEKPQLAVLVDNSASVKELKQDEKTSDLVAELKENSDLNDKFDISYYSFGSSFISLDSLSFSEKNTNISEAIKNSNELFNSENSATILITDGNQTFGNDYEFTSANSQNPIFSVILGDSIKYKDLKIQQLNTNRYAFLKNRFPVEVSLFYDGETNVTSEFLVKQGSAVVHRENVSFSETNNVRTISFTLPASSVGLQKYSAEIVPLSEEKNKVNNKKMFAVEVIDQATNVLMVTKIIHPDLGAFKKSITSNEQRRFEIKTPQEAIAVLNDYQLIILYQPDRNFATLLSEMDKLNKNRFFITGTDTDWTFLNKVQNNFIKEAIPQNEDVSGVYNSNYNTFAAEDLGFENFRPLKTSFGGLSITVPHDVLLNQSISGIKTNSPLLATMEINGRRDALLDAENIWKWRAQSFLTENTFENFDNFIGKIVQYLASNKRRSRLETSNEAFYYSNNPIKISAQYFDKNYVFDNRASLSIMVTNTETKNKSAFPLLLKGNFYEVDLSNLESGEYDYKVSVNNESISRSGNFTILDFNVEQQFLNADYKKLQRLSKSTKGEAYFISEAGKLIDNITENERFKSIQKSEVKIEPLIDWKILLFIIVFALAAEWFIRKYNGLV